PQERRDLATAWYLVGREYNDRESLANAKALVQPLTATGKGDDAADGWMLMASCDDALGDPPAAEKEYREALRLRPGRRRRRSPASTTPWPASKRGAAASTPPSPASARP